MKIRYDREQISARVKVLGAELTQYYQGKPLTVVVLMNGGMIFAADLIREIDVPLQMDSLKVVSYQGHCSSGSLEFLSKPKLSYEKRHILIVDDIFDSGLTMKKLKEYFAGQKVLSVRCCVLLDKRIGDARKVDFSVDWSGFCMDPEYVVGYGLDDEEEYRNLPYIGVID